MSSFVIAGAAASVSVTYNTSPPTLSNGQTAPLQGNSEADLLVSVNKLGAGALGQATMANSLPVAIASNQSAIPINLQDGAGSAVDKGQTTMSGSLPVVLPSNQSAIPINLQDGSGSAVNKGQTTMAGSLPVTLASNQTALSVTPGYTTIKNQMDTPVLDTSSTTINGSAGAFVQVVASLGNACTRIRCADTTGQRVGVYTGGSGSEALAFIINAGLDDYIDFAIAASTRVSLRNMASTSITVGTVVMQFAS